ncbi:MAG: response regulator [Lachnospiraceae bacterium]|nr:response regulator [Lachnospiraceae bacterium]
MKFQSKEKMKGKKDEISVYIEDNEYIANKYVMRCFSIMMLVFTVAFVLNLTGVFVIEQSLMQKAYIASVIIYFIMFVVTRLVPLSNRKIKFFILLSVFTVLTIMGVYLTYHVMLATILPLLYAMLYSSKRLTRSVYGMAIISTVITVYGGYRYGLCDANMVLLTQDKVQNYIVDGIFTLTKVNENPAFSLMLYFVIPRCLAYIAFIVVCGSIYKIVSGSLEKVKLTAELEKAKEEAERANHAKTQFLARVSHEIRTPINSLIGMNEMILRESDEDVTKQYAGDVKDSAMLLLSIVNDILDSSKIESGMMELVPVRYEMGSLLNDIYNMISLKTGDKRLAFDFDIAPEIPSEYFGDDKRIRQILLNLLTNAVKYTERGTVTLKITGEAVGEDYKLYCSVKDTGIGIKPEDIDKVKQAYRRVDMERNREIEGTGLGINIVQQLLELMGSELNVHSEYEKGSEFSFELMQKVINKEPLGNFRTRFLQARNVYRSGFEAPEAKVLVVDDHTMNLKVVRELMKHTKIQVIEAQSGVECLEFLKKEKVHLVFLDHMMPGMDGIETLHVMKTENLCEGIPVVMLTANAIKGDRERYLREGFDDFLSKPILPEKLDKMLLKHLPADLICPLGQSDEKRTQTEVVTKNVESVQGDEDGVAEPAPVSVKAFSKLTKCFPEFDYGKSLMLCGGDEALFMELFETFVNLPIKSELLKYSEEKDFKNYCIRIHGFKNNAYSVGATELGDLAYEMEQMTRDSMPEELYDKQQRLLAQYDRICDLYRKL